MRKFWQTLRFRFALWITALLLIVLGGFGAFVYITLKQSLLEALDQRLYLSAVQIQTMVAELDGNLDLSQSSNYSVLLTNLDKQNITAHTLTLAGEPVFSFGFGQPLRFNWQKAVTDKQARYATLTNPNERDDVVRVYAAPITFRNRVVGVVEVMHNFDGIDDTLDRLWLLLEIGIPLFTLVACFGGYWLIARALKRIDRITETARRISSEDLSARLRLPEVDDEVGRLSKTFDAMLERLEISFKREQQFANDAAHELRTPLTAMRTILEITRAKRRHVEQYEEAMDDLAGEVDRLQRLIDNLLSLVRDRSARHVNFETIQLSIVLADLGESLVPLAEAKGLTLKCAIQENLTMVGDYDDIMRLFFNLIDNAIKYTDQGEITIDARNASPEMLQVSVSDTGRGIAAEHIPFIFDRFYQVETSRSSGGTGLGLSIAQKIVDEHKGRIEVKSTPRQGTVFTVYLPKTAQAATASPHLEKQAG